MTADIDSRGAIRVPFFLFLNQCAPSRDKEMFRFEREGWNSIPPRYLSWLAEVKPAEYVRLKAAQADLARKENR